MYYLVCAIDNKKYELKLAGDNPKYGFEDKSIKRKGEKIASDLTKRFDDTECHIEERL